MCRLLSNIKAYSNGVRLFYFLPSRKQQCGFLVIHLLMGTADGTSDQGFVHMTQSRSLPIASVHSFVKMSTRLLRIVELYERIFVRSNCSMAECLPFGV